MKKVIRSIVVLMLLSAHFSMYAQQGEPGGKFSMGIEGGPGLGMLVATNNAGISISGENAKLPPVSGIAPSGSFAYTFQYQFNKTFSIRTGLGYERKAGVYHWTFHYPSTILTYGNNTSGYDNVTVTERFDYLAIPVLCRAGFGEKIRFFVNAGPYFGLLVHGLFQGQGTNLGNSYTRDVDFGLCFGAGVSIPLKDKFSFTIEARDNYGLLSVVGSSSASNQGTLSTNTANLILGFNFNVRSAKTKTRKQYIHSLSRPASLSYILASSQKYTPSVRVPTRRNNMFGSGT